jgi:anaerobic carbon-monoxide dehydrogenase iron sulfur subunit
MRGDIIMAKIKVTVDEIKGYCDLPVRAGDYFFVEGAKLTVPENQYVCIWALQSMMPVFPLFAEKDNLQGDHWVKSTNRFCCPDPKGLVHYRLEIVED